MTDEIFVRLGPEAVKGARKLMERLREPDVASVVARSLALMELSVEFISKDGLLTLRDPSNPEKELLVEVIVPPDEDVGAG
jgi:hypothetical protein